MTTERDDEALRRIWQSRIDRIREKAAARGRPCRGCGQMRAIGGGTPADYRPLCHACRRADRTRLVELEARIRAERVRLGAVKPASGHRRKGSTTSGRNMGGRRWRRIRAEVLAESDLCGICGHRGALTVDHIVPAKLWPEVQPGFDARENLQPAHGTMGMTINPCPVCGRMCNQQKGARLG